MNKNNFLPYFISLIGMFLLSPPYFAYGLIMLLAFNIVYSVTIYFSIYLDGIEKKYKDLLLLLGSGILTVLIHLLITFFSPIIGTTISFIIYLIPLATYTFDTLLNKETNLVQEKTIISFKTLGWLNIIAITFTFVREIIAFSSISYPTRAGIVALNIPYNIFEKITFFGSTIPGILILTAFFMMIIPLFSLNKKSHKEEQESN